MLDLAPRYRLILRRCVQDQTTSCPQKEPISEHVLQLSHCNRTLALLLQLVLPLLIGLLVAVRLHIVQSEAQENGQAFDGLLREVSLSDEFVVHVFDREVGEQSSVGELVARDVDFELLLEQVDVVVSPLLAPLLRLEAHGEGAGHLYCSADGEERSGDVVEEPQHFIVEVDRGAAELDPGQAIVLFHVDGLDLCFESLNYFSVALEEAVELFVLEILLAFELFDQKRVEFTDSLGSL